jgi:hypothetical protein
MKLMPFGTKIVFLIVAVVISTFTCIGQLNKNISLTASGNFNFGLHEFQTIDDAGFGISLDMLFFAKKRIGIIAETGGDWFVGDKRFYLGDGRFNKLPVIYILRTGPHFFVTKNIFIAATYGVARYCIRELDFSNAGSYKLSITGLLGLKKKFLARFYYAGVVRSPKALSYFGFSLGYSIL